MPTSWPEPLPASSSAGRQMGSRQGEESPDGLGRVGSARVGVRAAGGAAGPGMSESVDLEELVRQRAVPAGPPVTVVGMAAVHLFARGRRGPCDVELAGLGRRA